jgi:hypothetical protein
MVLAGMMMKALMMTSLLKANLTTLNSLDTR